MKLAFRSLAREKGFAAFAILTLALGIGTVTAIFSIVDGVLLKPLAYREPERLFAVSEAAPQFLPAYPSLPVNAAHFHTWQGQCVSCERLAMLNAAAFNVTGGGEPERVEGVTCTWDLFPLLGIQPRLGRAFLESEDRPGSNRVVVISDSLWRRRLGADPDVLSRTLQINGVPHAIAGVLAPDFRFPSGDQLAPIVRFPKQADIFKPMGLDWAKQRPLGSFNHAAIVRLRPGAGARRAESEMTASVADAGRQMKIELSVRLNSLQENITGGVRTPLTMLLAAAGTVLLIVCVNLGNLMLVRANERVRDAAVRRALGAANADLIRPVLLETLLIATAGGVLAVLVAYAGVRLLVATAPIDIPRLDEAGLDLTSMLFAFLLAGTCGVLCGIWPAIRAMGAEPAEALRAAATRSSTEGAAKQSWREWLVGVEVALSTVLLVLTALLWVSFVRLTGVQTGYSVDRILTADLSLPGSRYGTDEKKSQFHRAALEKLESIPGVRSAALVSSLPLKAQMWSDSINKEGDTRPLAERPIAHFRFLSERYFETMGIALKRGRYPTSQDRDDERRVALISESSAQRAWPGEDPVGRFLVQDNRKEKVEIIGMVADVRTESLDKDPPLMVYVPYWDGKFWQGEVWGSMTYVLRTSQDPETVAGALRAAIRELDAELPVSNVQTMREIFSESVGSRRFQTLLASVFGVGALLLACLGVYGVISYSVSRRTNEIGIRIALGAQSSQVSMLVMRQGLRPVVAGLILGVSASLWAARWISSLLFGTGARDPWTIIAVVAALLVAGSLACWLPARRASRVDPMLALRAE